jgi:hypothetical protein
MPPTRSVEHDERGLRTAVRRLHGVRIVQAVGIEAHALGILFAEHDEACPRIGEHLDARAVDVDVEVKMAVCCALQRNVAAPGFRLPCRARFFRKLEQPGHLRGAPRDQGRRRDQRERKFQCAVHGAQAYRRYRKNS